MVKKCVLWYLVFAMFVIGMVPRVEAGFVASEPVGSSITRGADLERIRTVLELKAVHQRLQDIGFTAEEIAVRLADMSDEQIHRLAQRLDEMQVGGDGGVIIGVIVVLLLVGIIYLFVTGRLAVN
jgi:hypothetical protein